VAVRKDFLGKGEFCPEKSRPGFPRRLISERENVPLKSTLDPTVKRSDQRLNFKSCQSECLVVDFFMPEISQSKEEKLKRGAVNPLSNLIFWQYSPVCKNGEMWMTPEKFKQKQKELREYQIKNKEAHNQAKKRFRIRHAERLKEVNKRYNKIARIRRPNYEKERAAKDPIYNLSRRVRSRIREALRDQRVKKSKKSVETIGCGWGDLRIHLELLFKDGMSWDNMNLWHIDHIIPLSSAKNEDELIRLCHFSNLQPLWAYENLKKGAKQFA
jgi:hypothetical protein